MPATFPAAPVLGEAGAPPWLAVLATATVAGLLLAVLGPFGNYLAEGKLLRAGYWVGAMWIGSLFYVACVKLSTALAPAGTRAAWLWLLLSVPVASIPEAALTRAAAFRMWPSLARSGPGWTLWYGQVLTIGLIMTTVAVLLQRAFSRPGPALPPALAGPDAAPAVAARLRGDILALQMEDHYVRVHSTTGSDLILMPLGRAIETVAVDGLRTHRSWWVARHAVMRVEGTSRSMSLRLSNGIVAPVARNSVASLRAAGWIEADN